jgi:hypothetical protein
MPIHLGKRLFSTSHDLQSGNVNPYPPHTIYQMYKSYLPI